MPTSTPQLGAAVGGAIGAVAGPLAVTATVSGMGFGAGGIGAGTAAAGMMSYAAIASGGGVVAGTTVPILQGIGAAGLGAAALSGIALGSAVVVGVCGAGVGELIRQIHHRGRLEPMGQRVYPACCERRGSSATQAAVCSAAHVGIGLRPKALDRRSNGWSLNYRGLPPIIKRPPVWGATWVAQGRFCSWRCLGVHTGAHIHARAAEVELRGRRLHMVLCI